MNTIIALKVFVTGKCVRIWNSLKPLQGRKSLYIFPAMRLGEYEMDIPSHGSRPIRSEVSLLWESSD